MRAWQLALLAAAAAAVIGFSAGVATRDDAGASGIGGQLGVASALLNYPPGWQLVGGPSRILGTPVTTTAALPAATPGA